MAERQRVLLLLPRRRQDWHDRLAGRLAQSHDVVAAAPFDLVIDLSETGAVRPERTLRPLYDGSPDSKALAARLQRGECPLLDIVDGEEIVASSYAAIGDGDRLATVFARVEALLLRALAGAASPLRDRPRRAAAAFSLPRQLAKDARRIAGRALAPLRRSPVRRHWNIALQWVDGPVDLAGFDLGAYTPLPTDPQVFYADPFVIEDGGRHFLFAEAYPYASGKGVIVCAEMKRGEAPPAFRTVLERPWHLSYPYVFRHEGEVYLMPESGSRGGVELYRAVDFPNGWQLERTLLEDHALFDSTLFEHDGLLWLFAAVPTPGGSDWDELNAWHAPALAGPWTPHKLNPIKSDCRSARPGGRPLRLGDRLIRPAQRCERFYGEALAWLEVTGLTPDAFEEVEIALWRAAGPGVTGPHTADLSTQCRAVDFRSELP